MKIKDIMDIREHTLSFEVFPPKTDDKYETVEKAVSQIATLSPDFMSVTYGAGGGTSKFTVSVAETIKKNGVTPLAHLTCVSSTKQMVKRQLDALNSAGIENILALRGDIPSDKSQMYNEYRYASELVAEIKNSGDFCVGGACYPEGHPESNNLIEDIDHLKIKVDAGCDFLTTQMFFDNTRYFDFCERVLRAGITVPIVAGIMPVTNANSIRKMLDLSVAVLPKELNDAVEKYRDDAESMKKAGVEFAIRQCEELYQNGVKSVHIYSMNKPDVAKTIKEALVK